MHTTDVYKTHVTDKSSMDDQSISIIIPALNERKNLVRLIPELHHVSQVGEIIVVDSTYSTDELEDAIDSYRKVQILKCPHRQRSIQLNRGARKAKGPILFFMHADMIPPKGFAESILQSFQEGFDAGCFCYRFDRESASLRALSSFSKRKSMFTGGGDQGLFLRKSHFEDLGMYREDLRIMEDFEFYSRLTGEGYSFQILDDEAKVSARKFDKNHFIKVNVVQFFVFMMYKLGLPQEWQISLYRKALNH